MSGTTKSPEPTPLTATNGPTELLAHSDATTQGDETATAGLILESTDGSPGRDARAASLAEVLLYARLSPPEREGSLGRIRHYEVMEMVGRGAMGVVLRAFDTELHRMVALKVLSPQLVSSESARLRFIREARAAAGINHPNIVTIHGVSEHAGVPFLIMEFVGGRSLADRILEEGPLCPMDVLRIAAQIASGLSAAHQQGIVHRDIKPSNIMLEDNVERVKITDFGLARVLQDQSELTSQGGIVGTPAYMSPEQVNGQTLDPRSDLFSLGCVLHAMLSGHSPFRAENALASARRIVQEPHAPVATFRKDVPAYLVQVVDRLLEKDPANRHASAQALGQELSRRLAKLNSGGDPGIDSHPTVAPVDSGSRGGLFFRGVLLALVVGGLGWLAAERLPGLLDSARRTPSLARTALSPSPAPLPSPSPSTSSTRRLTVSRTLAGSVPTLGAAIQRATQGTEIHIADKGVLNESIVIDDPRRLAGLRIDAVHGATIRPPNGAVGLAILGVPGVDIHGLTIDAAPGAHAIEARGDCPGLVIRNCSLTTAPDSPVAAVYLHAGASGTEAEPIRLVDLEVRCGGVGVVLGEATETSTVQHVRLERSRITATSRDFGIPLVLQGRIGHLAIERNLLTTGQVALSILCERSGLADGVVVANNSLGNFRYAWCFHASDPDQRIEVRSNLIVATDSVMRAEDQDLAPHARWFQGNAWERGPGLDEPLASRFSEIVDRLPLQSRDPSSDGYLRPRDGAVATFPGRDAPSSSDAARFPSR